jgi:hypothetical protein
MITMAVLIFNHENTKIGEHENERIPNFLCQLFMNVQMC